MAKSTRRSRPAASRTGCSTVTHEGSSPRTRASTVRAKSHCHGEAATSALRCCASHSDHRCMSGRVEPPWLNQRLPGAPQERQEGAQQAFRRHYEHRDGTASPVALGKGGSLHYGPPVVPRLSVSLIKQRWPRLYHLTEVGSWASIERHGLLSTAALLDLYGVRGPQRERLLSQRRPETVRLKRWRVGTAYIRDNKPMNETVLRRTLVGMDVSDYYRALNQRVFFFLEEGPLMKLRTAPPYRSRAHELLVLDTAALLSRYGDVAELSPYNSGAVHAGATVQRGPRPFLPIGEYPWEERRNKRPPIAELTVPGAVQAVTSLLIERRTLD